MRWISAGWESKLGRVSLAALAAAFVLAVVPALSGAVVLSPSDSPLPDSTFQGADGNQDDAAPSVDWQSLAASPDLATANDATGGADDIFLNGKEDTPVDWNVGTGAANPGKADLLASWSYIDSGTFLYLAFDRVVNQGNTFLAFELNQDEREWRNANNDLIPCRTSGDLIISYEIQNSNNIQIVAQEWQSTSDVTVEEAAGGFTNGVGCSKTGTFVETDPGADNAQAAINAAGPVTNYLPVTSGATSFDQGLFGEAALRMAPIVSGEEPGDPCFSFRQANLHTRVSSAFNSPLIDYTAPVPLCQELDAIEGDPRKRHCAAEEPTIRGTNLGEKIVGTPGNDVIKGRGGNDIILGKGGRDLICPNKGDDKAKGGSGRDTVRGGPDDDRLNGGTASDFVHGFKGDDVVGGGKDRDACRGGGGVNTRISCESR